MSIAYKIHKLSSFFFFVIFFCNLQSTQNQENFSAINNAIDVVIPCHSKDRNTLDLVIEGIKKNGKNIRRVIVVSAEPLTDKAEWFNEAHYPFTKKSMALEMFNQNHALATSYINHPQSRVGWIFQQLLKLYAPFIIPNISDNVLVVDADTIFLNPVSFIDDEGYALYNVGTEYNKLYFEHARRVIPTFAKIFPHYSGICHHMLFQRKILSDLFDTIQSNHNDDLWKIICKKIPHQEIYEACFSEYEIYFNFIFSKNYNVKIRPLSNISVKFNINTIAQLQQANYSYVSCHSYL